METCSRTRARPLILPMTSDGLKRNFGATTGRTGGTGWMELVEGAAGAVHLHEHQLEQGGYGVYGSGRACSRRRRSPGTWGRKSSSRTGCQRRACTMTARTRTSLPQRDAGLTERKISSTFTADAYCQDGEGFDLLPFRHSSDPGFNLDESRQFADASPNSALALLHRR